MAMINRYLDEYINVLCWAIAIQESLPTKYTQVGAIWAPPESGYTCIYEALGNLVAQEQTHINIALPRSPGVTPPIGPPRNTQAPTLKLRIQMIAIRSPNSFDAGWISHFIDSEAIACILPFQSWGQHTFKQSQQWHMLVERGDDG
jgi:hypothetical protein